MAAFLYQSWLLQYVWKGELWKLLFQLYSHKDKESYMIKEAAAYGKGKKKGKILVFFFQGTTMLQFLPLRYFIFWIIPLVSEFSL